MDGETIILIIRRFRCLDCLRIHHEFPDIVVPYKRYDAETIERIMISMPAADSEDLENQSTGSEKTVRTSELDFPCELSTALRLVDWFLGLLASLKQSEKTRQTMIMRLLQIESISIDNLKNLAIGWMKSFIRAVIVTEYTRFA
ncbi:MAG: DUF6431 domain-containing protein [Lachnospiraceae bacterium]|nr:DUF6431 domain-containing protein [Lachnospiraceae bacterium]